MLRSEDLTIIGTRLRLHGLGSLKEYYQSEFWAALKLRFGRSKTLCYSCGSREGLELHHLTYSRLCDERKEDLMYVCADCHEQIHLTYITMPDPWTENLLRKATELWKEVCKPSQEEKTHTPHRRIVPSERIFTGTKRHRTTSYPIRLVERSRYLRD